MLGAMDKPLRSRYRFAASSSPSRVRSLVLGGLAAFLLLAACNSQPNTPEPLAPPEPGVLELSTANADELIFSATAGQRSSAQEVVLKNTGVGALRLTQIELGGAQAASFAVAGLPRLPVTLKAGASLKLEATFAPTTTGVASAVLEVAYAQPEGRARLGLYGLASSEEGEPSLQQISQVLGYQVDVGSDEFVLGSTSDALGKEVLAPMFEQAEPGPVTLEVVARYGSDAALPYGFFTLDGVEPLQEQLGSVASEHARQLLPPLESGRTTFEPGAEAFGLYSGDGRSAHYSLDPLNQGGVAHVMRVYPLVDRYGAAVPNSYLVGLEQGSRAAYQDAVFVLRNVRPSTAELPSERELEGWEWLFNGTNLSGWYTYLPGHGRNSDPENVFKVTDGVLHILDVPNRGYRDFGYLATWKSYSDYHLRLEYKWGTKRYEPRDRMKRDSGIIYHFTAGDRIWPTGAEYQIQEGDTGDFWLINETKIETRVNNPRAAEPRYTPSGTMATISGGRVIKSGTYDRRDGWNSVDVIVRGNTAVHMINGRVNNRAHGLYTPYGKPLSSGKILLQAEGAEIYYRNIEIRPLD